MLQAMELQKGYKKLDKVREVETEEARSNIEGKSVEFHSA